MRRRRFLGCLACAPCARPLLAVAQAKPRIHRIGYLNMRGGPAEVDEAFVRGLSELGYVVGKNVAIEYRWAGGDVERVQLLADELARLDVDVIVTASVYGIRAAMRATRTIPIVMTAAADPVGSGLVASLGRPGGNVTGLTLASTDLARKRLQLIRELVPGATRVAVLAARAPDNQPDPAIQAAAELPLKETQAAAKQLGVGLVVRQIATADELPGAFEQYGRERAQALIVQVGPLTLAQLPRIVELSARGKLPALYDIRNFVDEGGLASYGPDLHDMYRRAASYVDRILRGAKPASLPIEQPSKFELVINLKAAQKLGLAVPRPLVDRADEVIR